METAKMLHRANEIARFWESYPRDEGVAGVREHIQKFWEPRFRQQLVEYARTGAPGLHDLVEEAVAALTVQHPTTVSPLSRRGEG